MMFCHDCNATPQIRSMCNSLAQLFCKFIESVPLRTLDLISKLCSIGYSGKNKDYPYRLPLIVNVKGKDNVTVSLDVDALQGTE